MSNPFTDIIGFYEDLFKGTWSIGNDVSNAVDSWIKSAAGTVATAIESGFLAIFKDLWDVIIGPVEVLVGATLILFGLTIAFKNDLAQAAAVFGMLPK